MSLKKILLYSFVMISISLPALAEKRISVLPFEVLTQREDIKQFGVGTMDTITNALSNIPEFIMIDRGQLNAVIKEQAFQQSGFSDNKSTTEIGKILGADILVLGSIQYFENEYRINAHFTEVKTGKILKTVLVTGNNIFKLQDQLASELIKQQDIKITTQQQESIKDITQATDSTNAYDYYIKGKTAYLLYTIEDYKQAINYFDKALETDKNYTLALAAKASAQAQLANEYNYSGLEYKNLLGEAESNAKLALSQNENLSEVHLSLGVIYNIKAEYANSKIEAEKTLKINPNDAEAYSILWMANSFINHQVPDIKNPLLLKSLELNPNLISTRIFLSLAYLKILDFEKSNIEAKKIIEISPNNMYGHYILGNNYIALGKTEEALKELNKALELNPNNVVALTGLGSFYLSQGKYDLAINKTQEAIKISDKNPGSHFILGMAYFNKDRINEAYTEIQKSIEAFPDFNNYSSVHNILGRIYKKQGKINESINEFKISINLMEKNEKVDFQDDSNHFHLGTLYQKQNNFEQAVNEFREVKSSIVDKKTINQHLTESYLGWGTSLYQSGKISESINTYKQALELNPDNPEIHLNLGVAYYYDKQIDNAITEYLKTISLKPENADAHYNLGIAYQSQNKNDLANSEYKKSCELGMKSACQ